MNKALYILSISILNLFILSSCTPTIIAGGAMVGTAAVQERSLGRAVDDTTIWTKIKNSFFHEKDGSLLFKSVSIKVLEGRVLLTGELPTQQDRLRAIKLVWEVPGVKEVMNEITIEKSNNSIKDFASDSWITTQIRSKLIVNNNVKSVNYSIDTIKGVVYLIGIAQSEKELDIVTNIAATTKNVKKVISYVRMKDSKVREEMLKKL